MKDKVRADIRIEIISGIVQIKIESTAIKLIIEIRTEIREVAWISISLVWIFFKCSFYILVI